MFTIITAQADTPTAAKPSVFQPGGKLSYVSKNGVSFAILRVRDARKIRWGAVKRKLGNSFGRVVCSAEIELPSDGSIVPVDDRRYSHLLTQNGLTELLKPNRPITCERTATLIDLGCRHQEFADILVRFFKTVRIVTRSCELYQNYVESKFYECGAAILISESPGEEDGTSLYVSPEGVFFRVMENTETPVICTSEPCLPNTRHCCDGLPVTPVISCFRAATPADLQLAPSGVDDHLYQAAVFHCCGVGKLATSLPEKAKLGGMYKSMNDLKTFLFSVDKTEHCHYN